VEVHQSRNDQWDRPDTHPKRLAHSDLKSAIAIAQKQDLDPKTVLHGGLKTWFHARMPLQNYQFQALVSKLLHREVFPTYLFQISPAPTVRLEDKVFKLGKQLPKTALVPLCPDKFFSVPKGRPFPLNGVSYWH
jgi:hypothetical protein